MASTRQDVHMPAAPEAERSILGAVFLDNDLVHELMAGMVSEEFYLAAHRKIYGAMAAMVHEGRPIDIITVAEEFGKTKSLESVGGVAYLSSLTEGVPRRSSIVHYVEIVKQKALLRAVIHAANATMKMAMSEATSADQCISELESAMMELRGGVDESKEPTLSDRLNATLNAIYGERDSERGFIGYRTGIKLLDQALMGLRRKELITVGAPPARAKTAFALQIAAENSRVGDATAVYSLEMADGPLLRRVLAAESSVPAWMMRNTREMGDAELARVKMAAVEVSKWPLHIDDTGTLTIGQLLSRARLKVRRDQCGLVIVDHLGLVESPGHNKEERVSKTANMLRDFAKSENVCVIQLAHVSRPLDKDPNKRPTMYDLRDSGMIEAHSNIILMPYRPLDIQTGEFNYQDEIVIAKHRESEQGSIPVKFNKYKLRYEARLA